MNICRFSQINSLNVIGGCMVIVQIDGNMIFSRPARLELWQVSWTSWENSSEMAAVWCDQVAVTRGVADWCWCGGLHCSCGWSWCLDKQLCGCHFCPTVCVVCPMSPLASKANLAVAFYSDRKWLSASWTHAVYLNPHVVEECWSVFLVEGYFISQIVNYYQEESSVWMVTNISGLQVVSVSCSWHLSVRLGKEWGTVLHFSKPWLFILCRGAAQTSSKEAWGLSGLHFHKTHVSMKWSLMNESNKQQYGSMNWHFDTTVLVNDPVS